MYLSFNEKFSTFLSTSTATVQPNMRVNFTTEARRHGEVL